MYIIREVVECKPGKVRAMVKRFKSLSEMAPKLGLKPFRIMTDVSGAPFWTVVATTEVQTIDEFFTMMEKASANQEVGTIMSGYHDDVVRGRREIYKAE